MKDLETKNKFVELRAKGLTYDKIADELEVTKRTLINWSKDFEEEIANLKATELEALQEQYFMKKEKKIRLFGDKFIAIIKELDKRDLSEIPTEKLFDLMIKYSIYLSNEEVELVFKQKRSDDEILLIDPDVKEWKG